MDIVNSNPVNETHANVKRSRSTFKLHQKIFDTHRFGEYHPHFVFDGVPSDKLPIRSMHNARSFTLKAPLMQDIQMHKDYFMVPLRSILPLNADKIITNPTIGDDVPADSYTNVVDFIDKIRSVFTAFKVAILSYDVSSVGFDNSARAGALTFIFKQLVFVESVFSSGSLLSSLGCNLNSNFYIADTDNDSFKVVGRCYIDKFFDFFVGLVSSTLVSNSINLTVTIDGTNYTLSPSSTVLNSLFKLILIVAILLFLFLFRFC